MPRRRPASENPPASTTRTRARIPSSSFTTFASYAQVLREPEAFSQAVDVGKMFLMDARMNTVEVRITSDFICPWCWIGEERLLRAIEALPEAQQVHVEWAPFELNPDMPAAGMGRREYRSRKFGSWERSLDLDSHVVDAGKLDGLTFNYDRIARTPNTRLAHRLTWAAAAEGKQRILVPSILRAYFERGEDIGDPAVLRPLATKAGLQEHVVEGVLLGDMCLTAVVASEARTVAAGVRGVPYYEIGKRPLHGAATRSGLTEALLRATEKPDGVQVQRSRP